MKEIFILEKLPIYVKNYQISLISDTSGLVELVQDAQSINRIKFDSKFKTLLSYFEHLFKGENFLYSLVGYSLASYILQIKDRHNGNLLMIQSFLFVFRNTAWKSELHSCYAIDLKCQCVVVVVIVGRKLKRI